MIGIIEKFKALLRDDPSSCSRAKRLAADSDPQIRKELAEREDIKPKILYFLTDDRIPGCGESCQKKLHPVRRTLFWLPTRMTAS